MVRLQDHISRGLRTEHAENLFISAMVAIYVEDNQIGIESRDILLCGANEVLRGESASGPVLHHEDRVGILLAPVCNHGVMPAAASDRLSIKEHLQYFMV